MNGNGGNRNIVTRGANMNTKFTGWWGIFRYKNEQIINEKNGNAVDAGNQATEGQQVGMSTKNNSIQQKWKIVYVDQSTKEPTEGFNE